jgi:two-component system phosphate regulon sensor histidine kinase PhoR
MQHCFDIVTKLSFFTPIRYDDASPIPSRDRFHMIGKKILPWPAIVIAVITCGGMWFAGTSLWLALGVLVLWIASLWLIRPEPPANDESAGQSASSQDIMSGLIEPLGLPLILFDHERIVAANAAARQALGAHIIGQDARIALRHPSAVRLLDLDEGGSVTIRGLTGARSLWQLTSQRIDERHWAIEMIDRTMEADVGRAHTDFVANASHELRTPLAAIIGYVETLADNPTKVDAETAAKFHATVLREARRMQHLVSDLMSLSQLEAEKHDAPTDAIELGGLAARVAGEFASTVSGRVVLHRLSEDVYVSGDAKQLEQSLRNLIDNALKYDEGGKPVTVSVKPEAGWVELSVADEGPGVAAEHLPHLTRRFYRTDPGRSRAAGGTGLGLAIVKHIVERHRGKLDITSAEGVGTRVGIRLPTIPDRGIGMENADAA